MRTGLIAMVAILLASTSLVAEPIEAGRVRVLDADTIRLNRTKPDVRLIGCNAPETRRSEATTPFANERRIFQCSSCRHSAQRLRFDRTRMPLSASPAITPSNAPTIKLQPERLATTANAVETQSSRALVPLEPHRPVDWSAVVGKISVVLKERRSEARAAAWARAMEKLRSRQMALRERAPTGDASSTIRECDHRDHHQGLMRTEASQGA